MWLMWVKNMNFRLIGRKACPIADFNDATSRTSIHCVQKGNVMYEFVDLPGVPDMIWPDGVGEYTFRRRNVERAKFGNQSLHQHDNANFATNDLCPGAITSVHIQSYIIPFPNGHVIER